ncbi:SMP-30/gluconolactonase/LRE family protein [Arsukibacterium indicum]|uniref:SMP-30/gluconolactonase/LRE family protein n=1 Tax=Arsukibacterium indicum TaxID=2848612 RepID=A0ABS6MQZ0_9GAMM|nr:SMP-30/gluconolactonase/LRE family protein [Arsukibacterium indicum]MBV2130819.1 SMP-30/gluconolactonase/LRE family protein [Arsukibacterium indicum]
MRFKVIAGTALWLFSAFAFGKLPAQPVQVQHPDMLQLFAADATLEVLAEGFSWAEGPVADPATGDILFSDVPENMVYRWNEQQGLMVYLQPSGYTGLYPENNRQQGANGLIFNYDKQLVLAQHGDRRLALLNGFDNGAPQYQTLVSQFNGKRLNSPNDLVQHSNGAYYFTDPPYGLAGGDSSAEKQLSVNGVYRLDSSGNLTLLIDNLTRPNGLAFSPDEQWLYVANSDKSAAQWWRYLVKPDGSLGMGELFVDGTATAQTTNGLPDGLKVLPCGTIVATGPGGVWVISPAGEHLGTIQTGISAANVTLSADNRYLYITATNYLLRIALKPLTDWK